MVTFQTARPITDSLHSAKAILQPREAKAEEPAPPLMRTPDARETVWELRVRRMCARMCCWCVIEESPKPPGEKGGLLPKEKFGETARTQASFGNKKCISCLGKNPGIDVNIKEHVPGEHWQCSLNGIYGNFCSLGTQA